MIVYYKATRLDGTDFYSGTVEYEVGKRVRPKSSEYRGLCGPGYLHAADVPSETLVGGRWPCRLFEVTGRPDVGFSGSHPHKGGFRQLLVVREIEAWRALGPNGRAVAALIERAGRLTSDEARQTVAALDAARGAAWSAARDAARSAARDAARGAAWGAAWNAAWGAAWGAAWNAAQALVVRDLISSKHFNTLYGPWQSVVGVGDPS